MNGRYPRYGQRGKRLVKKKLSRRMLGMDINRTRDEPCPVQAAYEITKTAKEHNRTNGQFVCEIVPERITKSPYQPHYAPAHSPATAYWPCIWPCYQFVLVGIRFWSIPFINWSWLRSDLIHCLPIGEMKKMRSFGGKFLLLLQIQTIAAPKIMMTIKHIGIMNVFIRSANSEKGRQWWL